MLRTLFALTLSAALASPSLAHAGESRRAVRPRAAPSGATSWGAPRFAAADAPRPRMRAATPVPAPAPSTAPRTVPAPGGGYSYPYGGYGYAAAVYPAPFWFGWGWGWGYYPLWGPRPGYGGYEGYAAPGYDANRITTELAFAGAGSSNGGAIGMSLALEGRTVGFHAGVDAFAVAPTGGTIDSASALGYGTAHVTWSLLAADPGRLRVELGGSMLSIPYAGQYAGTPFAGTTVFGPDVGVSGQLGIVGPFGFEGHARLSPYPVPIADLRLALAVRGGPLAVTAGWRAIDVEGDETHGPKARFNGPEIGLGLVFF